MISSQSVESLGSRLVRGSIYGCCMAWMVAIRTDVVRGV